MSKEFIQFVKYEILSTHNTSKVFPFYILMDGNLRNVYRHEIEIFEGIQLIETLNDINLYASKKSN